MLPPPPRGLGGAPAPGEYGLAALGGLLGLDGLKGFGLCTGLGLGAMAGLGTLKSWASDFGVGGFSSALGGLGAGGSMIVGRFAGG